MAAEHLKPWKNPVPNWKWCKFQCKEFTLEDWNSGWKVVFKTHTCQQLWKKKGFYLAHLSGLLVLVWIKRAQSTRKELCLKCSVSFTYPHIIQLNLTQMFEVCPPCIWG